MKKKEFIAFCAQHGLQCSYDGKNKTMYVSGEKAGQLLRHFTKNDGFRIVLK